MDDQIVGGMVAGLVGGLAVLLVALLKKPTLCPKCGFVLPRFRRPQNKRQALRGGYTCPGCNAEIDRKGRIVE
jgi:transposase